MKRIFAFLLMVLMLLSLIPVMPAYAWNKPATYPNGQYGVTAGSPHTLVPLWDNPQFIPSQNPVGRDWRDHMAPFPYSADKRAEGKVTGKLPAMGWNSWNVFGSSNSETTSKAIAESFIRLGMDKVGWQYIVLDDGCYTTTRNAQQELQPNLTRFPSGFAALAEYIHSLGLKMGMYNDVGITTCNGSGSASWGREDIDALTYAKWNIDYIKYDYCANPWVLSSANNNASVNVASPNIKAIRVVDAHSNIVKQIRALDCTIGPGDMIVPGLGTSVVTFADAAHEIPGYVNNLTDKRIQDGGQSGDLTFEYQPAIDGDYYVQVYYSSTSLGATRSPDDSARWLQMDVNGERIFDNRLPATSILGDTASTALRWTWSAPIKVPLKDTDNVIRLYCTRRSETGMEEYYAFFDGMNKAKLVYPNWNPIFSLCEWNDSQGTKWAWKVGDSWRTTKDISSSWSSMQTQCYNWTVVMDEYAGLDKGWNDPDMLEVGNSGDFARTNWNTNESHFNLWCMMNAPLMLGIDLRSVQIGDDMHKIIMNEDIIALNQDPLGVQAKRILNKNATTSFNPSNYANATDHDDILAKPLANNDVAIIICNFGPAANTRTTSITIDEIVNGTAQWGVGIGSKMVDKAAFENAKYFRVNDLGAKSKGSFIIAKDEPISVSLAGRVSKTFRISALASPPVIGIVAPAVLDTVTDSTFSYDISVNNITDTNTVEITAKFDSSKLTYKDSVIALPAASNVSFFGKPEFDDATGEFKATVVLLKQGELFNISTLTKLLTVNFEVKGGLVHQSSLTGQLLFSQYYEFQVDGINTIPINIPRDPAAAATAIKTHKRFDINGDGVIDAKDISAIIFNYYLLRAGSANWDAAKEFDANNDGFIDLEDLLIIGTYFGL